MWFILTSGVSAASLRGHQGDDGAILQAGSQFGPDQRGYRQTPGPAGGIQQGRFQGAEGCRVALGLSVLIEVPQAFKQRLGGRKIPGQDCRAQDLPEKGEAVAEHLPVTKARGPPNPVIPSSVVAPRTMLSEPP
jgi:hypothetical protein